VDGRQSALLLSSNWGTLSTTPPERIHSLTHPAWSLTTA
jgi:hypothetical protein